MKCKMKANVTPIHEEKNVKVMVLMNKLNEILDEVEGLSLAEAIGCLEIVKLNLYAECIKDAK